MWLTVQMLPCIYTHHYDKNKNKRRMILMMIVLIVYAQLCDWKTMKITTQFLTRFHIQYCSSLLHNYNYPILTINYINFTVLVSVYIYYGVILNLINRGIALLHPELNGLITRLCMPGDSPKLENPSDEVPMETELLQTCI